MKNRKNKTQIIWRLLDGKIGHEKQTLSLIDALKNEVVIKTINVDIKSFLFSIIFSMYKLKELPKPDFIIGAGHKTHISILYLKYIFGGKAILLMKPSLPCNWFDLCIIPQHDKFEGRGHIYWTKGALANTSDLINKNEKKGLILVGGLSKHYQWDSESVVNQIQQLLKNNLSIQFTLSTSRRTPKDFFKKINNFSFVNLKIHSIKNKNDSWLTNQMNKTKYAWISEDSISMIYESLTAGQNVGLISLRNKGRSRITNELDKLKKERLVFANENKSYKNKNKLHTSINEASRCAKLIKRQFIQQVK